MYSAYKSIILTLLLLSPVFALDIILDKSVYSPYQRGTAYILNTTPNYPVIITIEKGAVYSKTVVVENKPYIIYDFVVHDVNFTIRVSDTATNDTRQTNVIVYPYSIEYIITDNEIYLWDNLGIRVKVNDAYGMPAINIPCVIQTELNGYVIDGYRGYTNENGMIAFSINIDDKYMVDTSYNITTICYNSIERHTIKVEKPNTPIWVFNFLLFLSNNAAYILFIVLLITIIVYGYNVIRSAL